jgi:hypothetical protein
MKKLTWFGMGTVMLAIVVSAPGCSDDGDDGGTSGTGGTGTGGTGTGGTGTGGTGTGGTSTGGTGTGGTGTGGTGTGGTGTGGTGGSGTGGSAGAGGFDAQAFCEEYRDTCTFGGAQRFTDMNDCVEKVEDFSATRQSCVQTHVGFAEGDTATHCPHATGLGTTASTCGP